MASAIMISRAPLTAYRARRSVMPTSLTRLPRPRVPARPLIKEQDDRPDLFLGEEILPRGHRRIPRRPLARQSGAALGDPPEHEALGELRDRAVVLEVGRERVEPRRIVPLPVQIIAVAGHAILEIDPPADREMRRRISLAAERILE